MKADGIMYKKAPFYTVTCQQLQTLAYTHTTHTYTHVANLLIHLVVGKQHTHTRCKSPDSLFIGKQQLDL